MKRFILLVMTAVLLQFTGYSLVTAGGAGSSSGLIFTLPVTAKAAGVSESCAALSGEVSALHYNPAGIASIEGQQASMMYQKTLTDDTFGNVLYGIKTGFGVLAAGLLYYTTDKIEMYDLSGNIIKKTGQSDKVFIIGVGMKMPIENLDGGASLKILSSEIFGEKATAVAIDFGGIYTGLYENLGLGLSVQNLGTKLKYVDKGESLPLAVRPAAIYTMPISEYDLSTSLDLPYYLEDEYMLALIGVELSYKKMLALRLGYRLNLDDSDVEDESINAGIGFAWKNYSFDYAIGTADDLSSPHYVSLGMKF